MTRSCLVTAAILVLLAAKPGLLTALGWWLRETGDLIVRLGGLGQRLF